MEQDTNEPSKRYLVKAIFHGTLTILVGMLAGFALMISVLGEISIWPFYSIPVQMSGDPSLWRGAHTGPILNGMMCILLALALAYLTPSEQQAKRICNYLVYMAWGNTIFYIFRLWGTENRGLAFGTEQFGNANLFDVVAMIPAALAVYWGIYAVVNIISLAKAKY